MAYGRFWIAVWTCAVLTVPSALVGQDIADIDYEHLSFRGFGFDWGYMYPDRVEPTPTYAFRFDLGYAGPGLRIVPSISYWKSPFEASEIAEFTNRIETLVEDQTGHGVVLCQGNERIK